MLLVAANIMQREVAGELSKCILLGWVIGTQLWRCNGSNYLWRWAWRTPNNAEIEKRNEFQDAVNFLFCGPLLSDHSTSPFHANNLKISPCQYQLSKAQSTGYCNVENFTVQSSRCKCSGPLTPITYCTIEKTCLIMASLDWWRLIASSSFDIGRDSVLMILNRGDLNTKKLVSQYRVKLSYSQKQCRQHSGVKKAVIKGTLYTVKPGVDQITMQITWPSLSL